MRLQKIQCEKIHLRKIWKQTWLKNVSQVTKMRSWSDFPYIDLGGIFGLMIIVFNLTTSSSTHYDLSNLQPPPLPYNNLPTHTFIVLPDTMRIDFHLMTSFHLANLLISKLCPSMKWLTYHIWWPMDQLTLASAESQSSESSNGHQDDHRSSVVQC